MSVHYELTSLGACKNTWGKFPFVFWWQCLWPPDAKKPLIGKDSDAGKDWRQEEKGMTKNEIAEWHHQLNEHEFEQALGDGEWQGSLVCFSPWSHIELDITEWLNNKNLLTNMLAAADLIKKWRGGMERGQFKRHFKYMKKKINSHTCI